MNQDCVDLWRAFIDGDVRFLVVGAYALASVSVDDFARPGVVLQIGVPPGHIDALSELTGLEFADAWDSRESGRFGGVTVDFLGLDAFHLQQAGDGPGEGPGGHPRSLNASPPRVSAPHRSNTARRDRDYELDAPERFHRSTAPIGRRKAGRMKSLRVPL